MIEIKMESAAVRAALDRLSEKVEDTSQAMSDIAEYLLESTRKRFKDGGPAPDGTPWAPKSPVTLENYRRMGRGVNPKPLTHQGDLSLFGIHHDSGPDHAEIAASPIYAAVMQHGAKKGQFGRTKRNGPIPWGDIPARPFIGLSEADEAAILEIVEEYLTGAVPGGGR